MLLQLPALLHCEMQYCHCTSHSANIHSCFSFQISAFIASRIYDVPNFNRGILTLRRSFRFCCSKKKDHDQEKHVRKVFIYLCTLVTVYWMKPRQEIGCKHSMRACGKMFITGFMSMYFAVLFLIASRTTHLERVLSTVSTITLY